jgi:transposase
MRIEQRRYTAQTKIDAVDQVIRAGLSIRQVANQYEMPYQTLDTWVRKARLGQMPKVGRSVSEQEAETSRLRAQVARLTVERDILKKAAAYFAKDAL